MIKNVVFDVGRVLIKYEPLDYLKSLGFEDSKIKAFIDLIFGSPMWLEIDRGTYTLAESKEIFKSKAPELANDIEKILHPSWLDILKVKQETADFLISLKEKGYNIYILSNFSSEGFNYIENKYDFFKLVDGKIISAEVKQIKPEPEIYKTLLNKFSLIPEETVFIDDLAENIRVAEKFNINTILFTNIQEVIEKFNRYTEE